MTTMTPPRPVHVVDDIADLLRGDRTEVFHYVNSQDRLFIAVRHEDGECFAWTCRVIDSRAWFEEPVDDVPPPREGVRKRKTRKKFDK